MPRLVFEERALADLERLAEFLHSEGPSAPGDATELIAEALTVLRRHPLIGRERAGGLRELVISRGKTGYVALYALDPVADRVVVHAIRHQREAGFAE